MLTGFCTGRDGTGCRGRGKQQSGKYAELGKEGGEREDRPNRRRIQIKRASMRKSDRSPEQKRKRGRNK